ncbi:MAG TPA: hypothetical protein VFY56_02370 [Propionibacteriaceae bacterium]|nr:hypothetical protein [Propionibacteriaceae bacterium]
MSKGTAGRQNSLEIRYIGAGELNTPLSWCQVITALAATGSSHHLLFLHCEE